MSQSHSQSQTHPTPILTSLFTTPSATAIFSDTTRTQYYLDFEAALAKVQAKLNIIPQRAADEIARHCDVKFFNFEELKKDTETIGYPVLPIVRQLVRMVNEACPGEEFGEWAHWGATTQDVTDTATVLQLLALLSLLSSSLDRIITLLSTLSAKYKSTPLAARSNLQHAIPITYGFKLARLLSTLLRHRRRLQSTREEIRVLQFSGAAGTLATLPPTTSHPLLGLECQSLLAAELNLNIPSIAWHTERDIIGSFSSFLTLLTSTCAKFALDVKLQMQSEVREVSEPFVAHRGSSSTMPQKRNPVGCAYICAMNVTLRGLNAAVMEDIASEDHERSTGAWEVEWIVLPQMGGLSHAVLEQTRTMLEGLEVDEARMARNLEISGVGVVTENVMMMLARKGLGRQRAHDLVYDLWREMDGQRDGNEGDKGLVELLLEHEDVKKLAVERDEVEEWCDVKKYLGYSEFMVDQVLKNCEEEMRQP